MRVAEIGDNCIDVYERIGKKYQWIAYHELLARISDNYKLSNRFNNDELSVYKGPWNPFIRDIDPSSILYKKQLTKKNNLNFLNVYLFM